jgi:RNA polymerase subunit RPABC4/transcription elongation factor Spt4
MITMIGTVAPINHAITIAATQDVELMTMIKAMDADVARGLGDSLTFKADSMSLTTNADNMSANYSVTPTNDDVAAGLMINFTVEDGDAAGDWVMATITVADVNDQPMITEVKKGFFPSTITDHMVDLTGLLPITTDTNLTFTITVEDIDFDALGEVLTLSQMNTAITEYTMNKTSNTTWEITFIATEDVNGTNVLNFSVADDGGLSDWVEVSIEVNIEDGFVPPEHAPALNLTSPSGSHKIGDKIVITGTWSDEDGDDITMDVKMVFPDGKSSIYGMIMSKADYDNLDPLLKDVTYEYIQINADGTWTYTFDTKVYKVVYNTMGDIVGGAMKKGTMTFTFMATDDSGLFGLFGEESNEVAYSASLSEKKDGNGDGDGMDMMTIMIILIIIIVIIIVIAAVAMKKKKKAVEEEPAPEEGMAPPPEEEGVAEGAVPPQELQCTTCGAMIPADAATCPACGAAAPPPTAPPGEEAPLPQTCATCGAVIPEGSPTCPACGAPAPPPAVPPEGPPGEEMPPAEAPPPEMPAEGPPPEMPPPEMPAEAPPEMPAEAPPEMPTEAPPEMPAEAPPPEGAPPAEAPPPEGAPPPAEEGAAAPPAGFANCPQCGGQLAVGTTPCPSCGAALNW